MYVIITLLATTYVCMYRTYVLCMFHHCYCTTGALSITDDYYASYTVTMVDVRSCTRPPRSHDQQRISEHPHTSIPPRSPDQTRISECTGISRLPRSFHSQSSTNIGVFKYHYCVSSTYYKLYNIASGYTCLM